jgi:hypothetical protein
LYELLTRERLYQNGDLSEAARRVLHEPPPDVGELRSDVPPALAALLFELLAKEPGLRPSSAGEVADRLEAIEAMGRAEQGPFPVGAYLAAQFAERSTARAAQVSAWASRAAELPAPSSHKRRWAAATGLLVAISIGALLWGRGERGGSADGALWAGSWHTCALRQGALHCWGKNSEGQLGDGTTADRRSRQPVKGPHTIRAVGAGAFHTCALGGGQVMCWGRGHQGQLGQAGVEQRLTPAIVNGIAGASAIAAGAAHTCAVHAQGRVACWGSNARGQLGTAPQPEPAFRPQDVPGLQDVGALAARGDSTCAVDHRGRVTCWGSGFDGRPEPSLPREITGVAEARAVAVGMNFACAATARGRVACWGGGNDFGQLGVAPHGPSRPTPKEVDGVTRVTSVVAGGFFACALRDDGGVFC